jgi:hypothetical protein
VKTHLFKQYKNRFLAKWKYLLSFTKNDWELTDYPIAIMEKKYSQRFKNSGAKMFRYSALIINWHIFGDGDDANEALKNLKVNFDKVKRERLIQGKSLPRPGTGLTVEIASQNKITKHQELADDFIHNVLKIEWALLTDESSLWDFHGNDTNTDLIEKINEVYGVNVSDIESANISEILERISENEKMKNLS